MMNIHKVVIKDKIHVHDRILRRRCHNIIMILNIYDDCDRSTKNDNQRTHKNLMLRDTTPPPLDYFFCYKVKIKTVSNFILAKLISVNNNSKRLKCIK